MSLTAFLFYILIGLLTFIILKMRKRLNYWQSLGIPCEDPHFITGNITGIETKRSFNEIWLSYYNKFRGTGPFAGFYWFQSPAVFVLDTKLAKNILIKDFNKFTDRGFYTNTEDDPLTGQLFLLDGQKWRNMRMKLSPTFTSGKMKIMFPIVVEVAEQLIYALDELRKKSEIIEAKDILARFTMDVIGTCAFGIQCNSLKDPNAEFHKMGRKAVDDTRHGRLLIAFSCSFPNLARKLHIKQTPQPVENFFLRTVRETVDYREKNNIRRNDFMDMLIDLKNNKTMKSENGEELTNITFEELAAQAFVFLVAGFETSSTTMGFALYELSQHQDFQQKAREEVIEVLEKHNNKLTYETLKEMVYINQIVSETLRLYTVLPVMNRYALEDYMVPDNPKYVIKKGMPILIPANAIHRDEKYYPNPNEFNPDNFTPEKVKERDSIEWMPFGEGPRNCIGMRFGLMQTRIGLALLLKNFKFSVCSRTQIPPLYHRKSYLVSTKEGTYLKVEKV